MPVKHTSCSPKRRWVPASLLLAAACSLSAWAGPTQVPFRATLNTQEVLGFDPVRCPGTGIVGTITGGGTASQLGKVRLEATDCPVLTDFPPSFSGGQLTLIAVNGARVTAVYQGVLLPVDIPNQVFSISGQYTITGGTGRFSNARGSGVIEGSITLGAASSNGRFDIAGTLAY